MINFQELFMESKGQPIYYNDKEIKLSDKVLLSDSNKLIRINFVSTDSKWKQGIVLQTKGYFGVNGQNIPNKIVLWEHTAPKEVELIVKSKEKVLYVYNVWDTGDGTIHYGHNGGALYTEQVNKTTIYYCNDGQPNDDFNDLIVKIEYT